jgi:hypothetical protein
MKRILSILLAVMLLTVPVLSLAESDAAAEETAAEAEAVVPELLVTVNGEEILTDNAYMNNVMNYYLDYAQSSGYDLSDEELLDTIRQYSLMYTVRTILIRQKAEELGLAEISADEQAVMEEGARAEWQQIIDYYVEQNGEVTEESTEDEKAAARADVEAMLLLYGYDEASYVQEYIDNETET